MKPLLLTFAFLFTLPTMMAAQSLNQYRWKSRLVLLFTPSPNDPVFERQVKLLYEQTEALKERKLVFLFVTPNVKTENTDRFLKEVNARKLYDKFDVEQDQFELILVGLDGYEKFRAVNQITPPSVLNNLIDGMPMRQQELRREYNTKSTGKAKNGQQDF